MSRRPHKIRVGTCTCGSGSAGRLRKKARYQLIIAVTVPGFDQALRYCSRSPGVNVPGRLLATSDFVPSAKWLAEKRDSGMRGNWKNAMYQLRNICRGLVRTVRRNTLGCGTFR